MKKINYVLVGLMSLLLVMVTCLVACDESGVTRQRLSGDEMQLPAELKGLKVYSVSTGGGNWVRVAVLNGGVNSTTYMEGKIQETTIIVGDKPKQRVIVAKEILSETDSIIVIRK